MKVPFTTADFLDRAAAVYPLRTGVVDEPGPHQDGGLGSLTYEQLADRARGAGRRARRAGRRPRRAGRRRQPQQRPAARGVLRRHRLGPGAGAGQLPAQPRRGRLHRRALRRVGAARRPRARRGARRRDGAAPLRARRGVRRGAASAPTSSRVPWEEPDEDATATINYTSRDDGPPQGRADHPPQHLGQRRRPSRCTPASPTATSTCTRCRCSTPTAGGCRSR